MRRLLTSLTLTAAALLLMAASASASRPYLSQITEGNHPLVDPWALTVDSSDNLWTSDIYRGIAKFSPAGTVLAESASANGAYVHSITYQNIANHLFVAQSSPELIEFFNPDATFNSSLNEYLGRGFENFYYAAADNSSGPGAGTVYITGGHNLFPVRDTAVFRINNAGKGVSFSASAPFYIEGAQIFGTPSGPFTNVLGVAAGPTGTLYVSDEGKIDVYEPSGAFVRTFSAANNGEPLGKPTSLAVDPKTGNLLVVDTSNNFVDEFDPNGNFVEEYSEANGVDFREIHGVAVDSTGRMYVSDGGTRAIDVFGPATPPSPKRALHVEKTGAGHGLVSSKPRGISCGVKCTHEFSEGATVTLTAVPKPGNEFTAWSGCAAEPSHEVCEVEITAAKTVQAEFSVAPPARVFDTKITGATAPGAPVPGPFQSAQSVAIDSADNAWIGDPGNKGVITEYDPLGGYVGQQTGGGHWSGEGVPRSIGFERESNSLFVLNQQKEEVDVFNSGGTFFEAFPFELSGEHAIGIDNSGGGSQGRYYTVDNALRAFEPNGVTHEFSASGEPGKGYILGTKITGTPAGSFGFMSRRVAVGPNGEIFVFDDTHRRIDEFDATGTFVREITEAGVPGGFGQEVTGLAVDPTNGDVLVDGRLSVPNGVGQPTESPSVVAEFSPSGEFLGQMIGTSPSSSFAGVGDMAVNSHGFVYLIEGPHVVDVFLPRGSLFPGVTVGDPTEVKRTAADLHAQVSPGIGGEEIKQCRFEYVDNADFKAWADDPYSSGPTAGTAPCLNGAGEAVGTPANPITAATELHANLTGLIAQSKYHWRISVTGSNSHGAADNIGGKDFETPQAVLDVETLPADGVGNVAAVLHGSFTGEESVDAHFYFEYGTTTKYGHHSQPPPGTDRTGSGTQAVSDEVTELVPNTTYHFRVAVVNEFGTTFGGDQTFTTATKPTINAFSSSNVTASGADLHATIDPNGYPTTYRFEYGLSNAYGKASPDEEITTELSSVHSVVVHLADLEAATYHFRVIAESKWGSTTTEDQTFEFFPPSCPNNVVRQQTGTTYLPDCRAYELVSPGDANGTILYPGGPVTGVATNPARFSFTGAYSSLPGENVIDTTGDLYVATRTERGWLSKYIGLPGDQAGCVGGPPNLELTRAAIESPQSMTNSIATDPQMNNFLLWRDGSPVNCFTNPGIFQDGTWPYAFPSNAPYMFSADGSLRRRLPVEGPSATEAMASFDCPYLGILDPRGHCTGDVKPSGDLQHFAFSSRSFEFAEGGLTSAPGSAYDMQLASGAIKLISRLPGGAPIPQDPSFASVPAKTGNETIEAAGGAEEFIRFPAISTDGSHILMSTATKPTPECPKAEDPVVCPRFTDTPVHLYMSIDDAAVIEIAGGKPVTYIDMTPDGSRVYLTSEEQLTPDDKDSSTDLYMWSAATDSLTLLSKGDDEGNPGEPGNSDECEPESWEEVITFNGVFVETVHHPWTSKCDAVPYSGFAFSVIPGLGGNGHSDTPIATRNGDIYFYSPEQLDGDRGVAGAQNLYDYREGRPRFVASFSPERYCLHTGFHKVSPLSEKICTEGPIARINVAPDDSHAAFTTTEQLTSYDNAGHLEMYLYTSATGAIVCVSCRPDGEPPTSDVQASIDGLFMTDDGRTFFSTTEALVPQDTNNALDTYEYVNGQPQLISPGTGTAPPPHEGEGLGNPVSIAEVPGLVGVSADGTDVYFATFDGLVPEDHNGGFYRFYDARTNGGFPLPTPAQPCAAAEECHGPGTEPTALPVQGTSASLSGGNVTSEKHRKRKKKSHKKHHQQGRPPARCLARRPKVIRRAALAVVGTLLLAMIAVAPASAEVSIFSFNATPSTTKAGAHPDVAFPFTISNRQSNPTSCACTDAKDVTVHLPAGLIGNPHSTPQCTISQFSSELCPVDSQVGIVEVVVDIRPGSPAAFLAPVYNLVPPPNQPALFAFPTFFHPPVFEDVSDRTESDYGVDVTVYAISHFVPLSSANQVNWGVVADPIHDWLRFGLGQHPELGLGNGSMFCDPEGHPTEDVSKIFQVCGLQPGEGYAIGELGGGLELGGGPGHPVADNSPEVPFFENPTTCGETSLTTSIDILAYDGALSHAVSPYPATTACDQLSFNPSQAIDPTTTAADSPSGAEFRLTVPQFESPSVPSPSELRDATVTLPQGFSLAPNVTNGKTTCSDAEARFGTREEAHCPENSKIGTISVDTPVLPGTLPGSVYLGEPLPGNRFRLFLAFDGFGVHVKLAGTVAPDPDTGQIAHLLQGSAPGAFRQLQHAHLRLRAGPARDSDPVRHLRSDQRMDALGCRTLQSDLDGSSSPSTKGPDGRPCPSGPVRSHPGFQAASVANTAGAHTSFSLNLTRSDGEQNLLV